MRSHPLPVPRVSAASRRNPCVPVPCPRSPSFVFGLALLGCLGLLPIAEARAAETPGATPSARGVGLPTTVSIPPSIFTMGDGIALCASGIREVTLTRSYEIGLFEITNAEYVDRLQWAYDEGYVAVADGAVVDMIGDGTFLVDLTSPLTEIRFDPETERFSVQESPYAVNNAYPGGYDPTLHPAKRVSWNGAAAYCDWINLSNGLPLAYDHSSWACNDGDPYGALGYRLPTDAEWECATTSATTARRGRRTADLPPRQLQSAQQRVRSLDGTRRIPSQRRQRLRHARRRGQRRRVVQRFPRVRPHERELRRPGRAGNRREEGAQGGGFFYTGVYTRCANRDADPPGFRPQVSGSRAPEQTPQPFQGRTERAGAQTRIPAEVAQVRPRTDSRSRSATPPRQERSSLPQRRTPTVRSHWSMPRAGAWVDFQVRLRTGMDAVLAVPGLEAGVYYLKWMSATGTDTHGWVGGKVVLVD